MTSLVKLTFSPSKGQATKLETAFRKNAETTIQLGPEEGEGNYYVFVTTTTLNKVQKKRALGKGARITIKNPRKQIPAGQSGGSIFSALSGLAAPLIKTAVTAAPAIAKGFLKNIASGAVSALGSLGLNKLFGKGGAPNIGAISPLLQHLVSDKTTRDKGIRMLFGGNEPTKNKVMLLEALQGLSPETKKVLTNNLKKLGVTIGSGQKGGFLGTLAAVGIPLVMQLLGGMFGKGMGEYLRPPPFIGSWEGKGQKKDEISGCTTW